MNTVIDILRIAFGGLQKLAVTDFYLTIFGALVFSVFVGLACHFFYKLWNKSFGTTMTHKIMTVFSSVLSFLFIICFIGFTFLEEVSMSNILLWKEGLKTDKEFLNNSFAKAFYNVKELGTEDFTSVSIPENGGNSFPTREKASQLEAGKTYYNEAIRNFKHTHGFLSAVLTVKSENTPEAIQKDMERHFANNKNQSYIITNGIEIAAENLKESLFEQAPKVVKVSRILLVLLFFVVQLIPFGVISYSAYKDLKIKS